MTLARLLLVRDGERYERDGAALARHLLERVELIAGGVAYRIEELELYYYGAVHRDPFAHRDPDQREPGRWYFHRTGGTYRGGSFKGLDLTIGPPGAYGGVLLRSLRHPDGRLVSGPSLTVDALLRATDHPSVARLHASLPASALERTSPLHLRAAPSRRVDILRTARVGLSLKRCELPSDKPRYLLRPDRHLIDPRAISKGRVHSVIALAAGGHPLDAIHARTGTPRRTLETWLRAYRAGLRAPADFAPYLGRALGSQDLARLHGQWRACFEDAPSVGGPI